jgi:hypothetical protein
MCQHIKMSNTKKIDRRAIDDIFSKAGGEIELSYLLTKRFKSPVSQFALRQWRVRGIPEKYWPYLEKLTGISEENICKASGK